MNALTEFENTARHHITERTRHEPHLPPREPRRTEWAATLRRVADRLDS